MSTDKSTSPNEWAQIAGLEAANRHLSALVDEQRELLAEVEDVCGRDAFGAPFEDGDCDLIDKVRAHLEKVVAPQNDDTVACGVELLPHGQEQAAVATLERLGYSYEGGTLWRPPLGPCPTGFRLQWPAVPETTESRRYFQQVVAHLGQAQDAIADQLRHLSGVLTGRVGELCAVMANEAVKLNAWQPQPTARMYCALGRKGTLHLFKPAEEGWRVAKFCALMRQTLVEVHDMPGLEPSEEGNPMLFQANKTVAAEWGVPEGLPFIRAFDDPMWRDTLAKLLQDQRHHDGGVVGMGRAAS